MKSASAVCTLRRSEIGIHAAGVQHAGRVERGLETTRQLMQRIADRLENARLLVVGAKERRVPAVALCPFANARGIRSLIRVKPAQRAAPLDQLLAVEIRVRCRGLDRKPPKLLPRRRGSKKKRLRLL